MTERLIIWALSAAVAAIALSFGLATASSGWIVPETAEATVAAKRCGKIQVRGKTFVVKAHLVKCRFARRWSRRVLSGKGRPKGWSCRRYAEKQTRIAFICRKAGKDFFAIRK